MRILTKRRILILGLSTIVLLIISEVVLRTMWGFGNMVTFFEDPAFEYLPVPNQDRMRFGNHISYNNYSMRSRQLASSDSCIVLGLGDSVINGGTLTDQDSLATTMVEDRFNGLIRFLNISAGSWGPDNCAGYIRKYGDFNAKMIVLFVSSHDAHDNMMHEKIVGVDDAYPDKQYLLAIVEVVDKYLLPRIRGMLTSNSAGENLMINKHGVGFNKGFQELLDYTRANKIALLLCLHAERSEVNANAFNSQGQEILEFCTRNDVKVITGLQVGEKLEYYRDDIHLNERGQKAWVAILENEIRSSLNSCIN